MKLGLQAGLRHDQTSRVYVQVQVQVQAHTAARGLSTTLLILTQTGWKIP